LLVQLYAHELPGMLRGRFEAQVELARRLLQSAPLGRRYVLERAGAVVGMGCLATYDEPRPEIPLRHLEEDAIGLGKRRAVLQVITSNVSARRFYRSAGYSEAELRRGFARDRLAYSSVLMRRGLA
jgi:hypothetical protein